MNIFDLLAATFSTSGNKGSGMHRLQWVAIGALFALIAGCLVVALLGS